MNDSANVPSMLARIPDLAGIFSETASTASEVEQSRLISAIAPVVRALFHGEDPNPSDLDIEALQQSKPRSDAIARAMSESNKADIQRSGLLLLGALDDPSPPAQLVAASASERDWERAAAIDALALMSSTQSTAMLESLAAHDDPDTRRRAAAALQRQRPADPEQEF